MAKCDEGYRCCLCGQEVEEIVESDLYLRYVIGWVDPETLHTTNECHLRCNPRLSQFIEDDRFSPPVRVDDEWDKQYLDPSFVKHRTQLVTLGYRRLWEIFNDETRPPVIEYPLSRSRLEAIEKEFLGPH